MSETCDPFSKQFLAPKHTKCCHEGVEKNWSPWHWEILQCVAVLDINRASPKPCNPSLNPDIFSPRPSGKGLKQLLAMVWQRKLLGSFWLQRLHLSRQIHVEALLKNITFQMMKLRGRMLHLTQDFNGVKRRPATTTTTTTSTSTSTSNSTSNNKKKKKKRSHRNSKSRKTCTSTRNYVLGTFSILSCILHYFLAIIIDAEVCLFLPQEAGSRDIALNWRGHWELLSR